MAANVARLARLTLFSGPNCSLCDTAKAELAKVHQRRPFQLETINIQDKGQEKWKRKYVYWIPALHIEGKEVAKGRWDAQVVNEALDEWEKDQVVFPPSYDSYGTALGAYEDDTNDRRSRRCFNCGSLDHAVSECPTPRNPGLISLSRQYYEFYKDDNGLSSHRLHEVEDWRRQRIEWLETFEPGQVKGELLRDALGLQEGDTGEHVEWLRNMAVWGYPKGWVGSVDPRLRVWKRIMREDDDADAQSEVPEEITIFGEEGEEEDVLLPPDTLMRPNFSSFDEGEASSSTLSDNHSLSEDCAIEDESSRSPTHRWVTYPDTYFSSSRLPIYNGLSLPPIGVSMPFPPRPNFPYPLPGVPRLQPYERPSSWHVHGRFVPPPPLPPPSSPPPLPPGTPPPPPPPSFTRPHLPPLPPLDLRSHGSRDDPIYILDDSDMEFSDSE